MKQLRKHLGNPSIRPFLMLAAIVAVLVLLDGGQGRVLTRATAYSVLQQFVEGTDLAPRETRPCLG